jgi:DNA sulfur modification protein DndD
VIERLQTDTGIYISRLPQQGPTDSQNREEETLRSEIDQIEVIVEQLRVRRAEHEQQITELQSIIASLEGKIASEGGSFAKNREELFEKQGTLKANIKLCEELLKDECAGLLPFALIPNLCVDLKRQLELEALANQRQTGTQFLRAGRKELLKRLESSELWKALHAPANEKQSLRKRLRELITKPLKIEVDEKVSGIHQLSPAAQRQLLTWIDRATTELPLSIKSIGMRLETFHRELDTVESRLRKVPPEEILKPLIKQMSLLHEQLTTASKQLLLTEEEIKRTELNLSDVKRKHSAVCERIQAAAGHTSKFRLVHNLRAVLDEYKSDLLTCKITQIEDSVSECFNTLCRKKDTLRKVRINPRNFAVTLFDKRDQAIPKERLSAGEKQIYAVSMLWALGKTSGRPLPVIIDTPLARLDSDHRRLLINNYFPAASHQTLILSTDTEVDQSYFSDLKRGIAHSYRLEFDPEENCTKIASGYFWRAVDEAR